MIALKKRLRTGRLHERNTQKFVSLQTRHEVIEELILAVGKVERKYKVQVKFNIEGIVTL